MPQNLNRLLALILIVLCAAATLVGVGKATAPSTASDTLAFGDRLLLLTLEGAISGSASGSPLGADGSALGIRDRLLEAAKDERIKGVLLRIDSPGGTVGASEEVYNAVMAVRAKKPVVVSMGDVAASGGYYIAAAGDRIFANPGTLTGSIGVIISGYSASRLLSTLGVEPQVVKSGKFKDILSLNRALTPDERSLLQATINDTYNQFLQDVSKGRNKPIAQLRPLADGRIFTGRQAQALGLVDELGGQAEAKAALQKLARERFKIEEDLPFTEGPPGFSDFFRRIFSSNKLEIHTPAPALDLNNSLQPLWLAPGLRNLR
ncbi:signal peptide peptidase SppA [Anthocerotibacter panamensis]|uniref:signal peptide peptidase SppA n=1 Tax=Anthocerotibacter panamensis TaxID=2857077 RepID=UPI001C401EFA|nr:signal peptide peptidase SppA [Anthocerotibacter panamensis]